MSNQFYSLKIKQVVKETADCVSITFDLPLDLKDTFAYKAGQYINVKTIINDQEVRRSYSICSAPHEGKLTIAVKKVDGGLFSTFANDQLNADDILDIMPPHGNFCLPADLSTIKTIVFYCAGSGITPAMSLIKTILSNHPHLKIQLYYGNKNADSILFREELEGLKNLYLNRFSVNYILSREVLSSPLFYGRINGEKCKKYEQVFNQNSSNSLYYLCGPASMIFDVKECLTTIGVNESNIHFELFNAIGITENQTKKEAAQQTGNKIKIKLDELEFEFIYDGQYSNILDAALANGADLPFACKGGVCSTCKGKCESGTVAMKVNYALEPDELAAGYVLTCQAYPTSDEVFINFDS
jgi:ring-1,2-phenylacetyl-CoA epoxidase subunit PaaE